MHRNTSGTQRNLEAESSSATLQLNPAEPIKTHQIPPLFWKKVENLGKRHKPFSSLRLIIYCRNLRSDLCQNYSVEFYVAMLLKRFRNRGVECGSNPSSNSRWPTLFSCLEAPKSLLRPKISTYSMVVV